MEQRIQNLEELCELITKQVVEQNKNIIDVNQNLINEIRSLRAAFVKQDEDFEEFKNLLRKIYDQNRQPGQMIPPAMMPPPVGGLPTHIPPPPIGLTPTQQMGLAQQKANFPPFMSNANMNNSFSLDQINQSMVNNLSFQSERTPVNANQSIVSNQYNNTSLYSIPSSASALNQQMMQQQQQHAALNQQTPLNTSQLAAKPAVPVSVIAGDKIFNPPPVNAQQPPPFSFGPLSGSSASSVASPQKPSQAFPPKTELNLGAAGEQKFSFAKNPSITSTPQAPISKQPQAAPTAQAAAKPVASIFNTSPSTATTGNLFQGFKPTVATKIAEASTAPAAAAPFSFGSKPAVATGASEALFKAPAPKTFEELNAGQDDEGEGSGNPEEYEPQVDFKPIVKLAEVEVKTGEEDEEVIFKDRCKLFRFIMETKEWKEKGAGEIKILKHKTTGVYRILMRRDQVLKLCANHRVKADMKLTEMSPKQYSWYAVDFSENESKNELLCARFRTPEDASKFKSEFDKAVEASKSLPASTTTPSKPAAPAKAADGPKASSLSEQFKTTDWTCKACYAPNKQAAASCACCNTPKGGTTAPAPAITSNIGSLVSNAPSTGAKEGEKPLFGSAPGQAKPLFSFGQPQPDQSTGTPPKFDFGSKPGLFGAPPAASTQDKAADASKPTGGLFGKPAVPSFSGLASSGTIFGNAEGSFTNTSAVKPLGFGGGLQANPTVVKPMFGSAPASKPQGGNDDEDNGEDGNANPEEYEPQVDFKPIVKLAEVEVKTGEEDEEVIFKERCKLYRFIMESKEWKEKGAGEIKILKHKTTGVYRILMRRDQVLKLCANHRVKADMKLTEMSPKQYSWYAVDFSENESKNELLCAKFRNQKEAAQFKEEFEKAIEASKSLPASTATTTVPKAADVKPSGPSLSDQFKTTDWKCKACYAPNKQDAAACACCSTPKDGTQAPAPSLGGPGVTNLLANKPAGQTAAPILFGTQAKPGDLQGTKPLFSFGSSQASTANTGKIEFGSKPFGVQATSGTDAKKEQEKPANTGLFGSSTLPSFSGLSAGAPTTGGIFGNTQAPSFADAAFKPMGFGGGFGSGAQQNQPKPLFGSGATAQANDDDEGEGSGNPEEYEPQVDFKPIVKLAEVEVKTGEEDEEVIFKDRCKLFRFIMETKEWKEKGAGEIKILKHKTTGVYRILMRRDQVLKLCANHRVKADMKLTEMSPKQYSWYAVDFSENESKNELLCARFRTPKEAVQFKEEFEKAIEASKTLPSPAKGAAPATAKPSISGPPLFKQEPGAWSCTTCLANNQASLTECACCKTPKASASKSSNGTGSEDDVTIVNQITANAVQVQKAKQFGLPDNFYLYENKPPCAGCRGCEKNEE